MLKLIKPNISDKEQWEQIMAEWDESRKRPRIFFKNTYEELLERVEFLRDKDDIVNEVPKSSLFFLVTEAHKIVGFYWLRHNLNYRNDALSSGHIGYGIRPTERGKGYAKEGLKLLLQIAKQENIGEKVLITCDDDNIASIKVIEANGGILEKIFEKDGMMRRRYWIHLE